MAQADYTIDNASGATVRADINATLAAIVTQNSGASAPATTFAHMLWADTTNGVLKRRNAANSGWVVLAPLASTMVQAKSANYTVLLNDYGTLLDCTNTIALSLTAAATLGDGFWFAVRNSGSGIVTIDPSGAETIDGAATIALGQGDSAIVWCNGTAFKTVGRGSAQLYAANTFTADQTIRKTDDGSGAGPTLTFDRHSASPATFDALGNIVFVGRDAVGNAVTYANLFSNIVAPTAGAASGGITFSTLQGGSLSVNSYMRLGFVVGNPTGGDKGAGTINAQAVYDDNSLLTCYALEAARNGSVDVAEWDRLAGSGRQHTPARAFVERAARDLDPDQYAAFWKENGHLPAMPSRTEWETNGPLPTGALIQRLWETVEVQAAHIAALNERLKAVEGKV